MEFWAPPPSTGKRVSNTAFLIQPVLWKPKLNIFFQKPIYSGKHNTQNLLVQFINLFRIYMSTDICVYMQCLYGKEIRKSIQWNKVLLSIKAKFNRTCPLFTKLLKVIEIFFPQDTELCRQLWPQNCPKLSNITYTGLHFLLMGFYLMGICIYKTNTQTKIQAKVLHLPKTGIKFWMCFKENNLLCDKLMLPCAKFQF